ncbi:spore photoproduct lyase [Desulfohalotomaculum tongense]|uniref:SPL family radical SAM protein n=1 Tax=Desulforadius tongensis TaxID=1216062 RepID=UPI00195B8186|nr:radical SAM protein [Desulforadius tongensis]MBM7855428.1 spore photoproduct lyase [Desulforadius tongensis]
MAVVKSLDKADEPWGNLTTVVVDSGLLLNEKSYQRVINALNNMRGIFNKVLFLYHNLEEKAGIGNISSLKDINFDCKFSKDRINDSSIILKDYFYGKNPSLVDKLDAGKKILYLGERRSKFIDTFTPPKGLACHKFYKVVLGTGCPFNCSYCFLQLTFRMTPYVRQYLNLESLFKEIDSIDKIGKPVLLNSGELSDSLAVDPIVKSVEEVIDKISNTCNVSLLLVSKGTNVNHLPDIKNNKVIISASLTTPINAAVFEDRTADPYSRIDALARAKAKGYRIRCRIDPIITYSDNWEEEYSELIDYLFDMVEPEVITLGQLRFYPMLLQFIKKRHPKAGEYFLNATREMGGGGRCRTEFESRAKVYKKIINLIRKKNKEPLMVAPCKEEYRMCNRLQIPFKGCNCI